MDFRIDHYNIFVAATNDSQCWPGQHRLALAVYLHLSSSSQPAAGNCCWGQLEMSEKVPSVCLSSWGKMNNSLPIRRLGDIGQQKVTMSSSLNSNWLNVSHWQARRRDNAVVTFLQRFLRPLHPATPPSRHLVTENSVQLLVSDHIRVVGWESINPNDQAWNASFTCRNYLK